MSRIQSDDKIILSVESVVRHSENHWIRRTPKWVLNQVSNFLYEKEFNHSLSQCSSLYGFDWINGILQSFDIKVMVENEHNVKDCGRAVFVPNHPIGGLDGMAVLSIIGRYHKAAKSLSSDFLMVIPNVVSFIIPVSTSTSKSRDFLSKVDELYASNDQVLCFAAGQVSRSNNGSVEDLPWSKSFISKAVASHRNIVPVNISTFNHPIFYRYQKLRRIIKRITGLSIERFFILRAQHHQRNNTVILNFGRPIPYTTFDNRFSAHEWAQKVRNHVYAMGPMHDPLFNSVAKLPDIPA